MAATPSHRSRLIATSMGCHQRYSTTVSATIATGPSAVLPVLDISPYMEEASAGQHAREQTARALDSACRDPGFFYLVGHGVPNSDIENLHVLAKRFFALPQERKEEIALSHCPQSGRGYQRLGENVTQGRKDWHEAIDFYAERTEKEVDLRVFLEPPASLAMDGMEQLRPFVLGRNQWPDEPQGFQAVAETHFRRMADVGGALMRAMADAFGLPGEHFAPLVDRSFWCARVIGYPPVRWAPHAASTQTMGVGRS